MSATNTIATINTNATTEIVEFAPAAVRPEGKTRTDRAVSIVQQAGASHAVMAFAAGKKGKVGEAARSELGKHAPLMMAQSILSGNYKPAAAALALELDDIVEFGSPEDAPKGETQEQLRQRIRTEWEFFPHQIRKEMRKITQHTKSGKVSPKWAKHEAALNLHSQIQAGITAILEARKAKAEAAKAAQEGTK